MNSNCHLAKTYYALGIRHLSYLFHKPSQVPLMFQILSAVYVPPKFVC